jgi:hypothetical protein
MRLSSCHASLEGVAPEDSHLRSCRLPLRNILKHRNTDSVGDGTKISCRSRHSVPASFPTFDRGKRDSKDGRSVNLRQSVACAPCLEFGCCHQ